MYMIEGDASLKNKPVPFLANQSNLFPGFGITIVKVVWSGNFKCPYFLP